MPLFSASSTPSLNASICTASERLIAIFIVTAEPFGPRWNTFGPIASSTGLHALERVLVAADHDREPSPARRVIDVPETGASSICAPTSATRSASARVFAGLAVLMST